MDENWIKKFRVLTLSLIFSGALNIGLIAAFIATRAGESKGASISRRSAPAEQKVSNLAALETMSKMSFRELVSLLTNRELIEEGYSKRDLALSALTAYHHFNIEKALSGVELQKRVLKVGENRQVELFPSLSDEQFEAVIRYAYQEKWPLTSEGLFTLLKKLPSPRDPSLEQAFVISPEFYSLEALFKATDSPQESGLLLSLALEGNWDLIDRFAKEQAQMLDLTADKRRRVLLSYLTHRSPTAAHLLLKTDLAFALKKLDDRGILELLSLATQKSEEAEQFCIALLQSPRSDAVWRSAVEKLYSFAGESLPEPFDLRAAAARFAPVKAVTEEPKKVVAKAPALVSNKFHVVQNGESLWKIARQYKVKVDDIVQLNGIEKDRLYPGMTIQIP